MCEQLALYLRLPILFIVAAYFRCDRKSSTLRHLILWLHLVWCSYKRKSRNVSSPTRKTSLTSLLSFWRVYNFANWFVWDFERNYMSVKYPHDIEWKEILIRFLSELVKTHIEEVKRLWPNIRRAKGEFVVKCLGVSFDSFRQEVWVRDAWNV